MGSGLANLARFYMGLLQISGPKGGQRGVLPTKVVVEIADIQGGESRWRSGSQYALRKGMGLGDRDATSFSMASLAPGITWSTENFQNTIR